MKKNKGILITLVVLIAVVVLGIGYAAITAITLTINGTASANANQDNFQVLFDSTVNPVVSNATATIPSERTAQFTTNGLTKEGDIATVTYTIKNSSPDLDAKIAVSAEGDNDTYFNVSSSLANADQDGTKTIAANESTTVTITVTVKKTPIETSQSTTITATLTATPIN